ncbi:unnamed protein product [Adineta steineri]|uniref:G-protein coupled receptors family 1 profile domain-containing protein n=1 Tax=Adineta steineri TaxID=433720 RepID=A0A814UHL7_9BILA|nr:unnamed protein product [Adineta steineri]CAF1174984.1 unnamed protein product [Adineta steineri]
MSQEQIYKCNNPWFGSTCQYIFNSYSPFELTLHSLQTAHSFELDIKRSSNISSLTMTCYTHLICNRGPPPACLDWREICDGKIDCGNDNGIDELFCEYLEILKCAKNEYRCLNGRQCIPEEFYRDDPLNPDCQDGSDEIVSDSIEPLTYPHECDRDPAFRCEERTCPPNTLSCGDGQCVTFFHQCNNHRGELLIMEFQIYRDDRTLSTCQSLPYLCGTHIDEIYDCQASCWSKKIVLCKAGLSQLCASTVFKQSPSYFRPNHDMYIFYNDNPIPSKRSWIIAPHDNCYNDTYCHNTEIYSDTPHDISCRRNQAKMHLNYVGSYSRSDFTATIQRLTKRCYKNFTMNNTDQKLSYKNSKIFDLYNDDNSLRNNQSQIESSIHEKRMSVITGFNVPQNRFVTSKWTDDSEFFKLCDRIQHFNLMIIGGINYTDETECDHWPCNNIYTRCNGYINCPDGADELNCSLIRCMDNEVLCVSIYSRKLECLPQNKVKNAKVDCIGGTDERLLCGFNFNPFLPEFECSSNNKCINNTKVCNNKPDCSNGEDEYICNSFSLTIIQAILHCGYSAEFIYAHSPDITCSSLYFSTITFLSSMDLITYPPMNLMSLIENRTLLELNAKNKPISKMNVVPKNIIENPPPNIDHYCHRGHDAYMVIPTNKNLFERKCFCPPSYYGNRCQYQSDRVSLTFRIQFSVNHRDGFIILITLIDKKHNINSFHIHKHRPVKDCDMKFNYYLLYSTPKKDIENNYSIHIDLLKEEDSSYYASWHLPIHHSYLPVSRIAALLRTPHERVLPKKNSHCNFQCQHGQCIKYSNADKYFCQCQPGWDATCQNGNPCEKEGRCLEDRPNCPSLMECICSECYYGTRCQFSTVGLGVSLDAMLGYEILPMKSLFQQPTTVKVSAIITVSMFVFGLVSNIMSIIAFQHNQSHEIGCTKYLLMLSITSLLTIIMFTLKFWFFLLIQMSIITDAIFLYVNCLLMEVLTKICLSATNWLGACVAIERTVSVIQQIKFNRKKSNQVATKVVFALIFCVVLTHISDPIYRVLINDEDEQRKWCIVRYPLSVERFNSINLFLHFVVPFVVNGISAMIIIIIRARIRFAAKKQKSYLQYLLEEVHQLGHLLISPSILVLLSVPRLILAFLPGCMKTTEDLWIYLAGYFVSFVPALLTFPIFVLPSYLYRKEFINRLKSLLTKITGLCRRH